MEPGSGTTCHKDYAQQFGKIGELAGDPVYQLCIDSINHPMRKRQSISLNDSQMWYGWRGMWHVRSHQFGKVRDAMRDNVQDPEATAIWHKHTYDPTVSEES